MSGRLMTAGERPHGPLKAVGFLLLGVLYITVVMLAVGIVMSAVLWMVPDVSGDYLRFALALAYLIASSLLIPFLVLVNITRFPRLQWACWWLLLVDAVLRMVFAAVRAAGGSMTTWGYGTNSFWLYDFTATRTSSVLAAVMMAGCTMAVLYVFWRRQASMNRSVDAGERLLAS